jgi:hypothetical protein
MVPGADLSGARPLPARNRRRRACKPCGAPPGATTEKRDSWLHARTQRRTGLCGRGSIGTGERDHPQRSHLIGVAGPYSILGLFLEPTGRSQARPISPPLRRRLRRGPLSMVDRSRFPISPSAPGRTPSPVGRQTCRGRRTALPHGNWISFPAESGSDQCRRQRAGPRLAKASRPPRPGRRLNHPLTEACSRAA